MTLVRIQHTSMQFSDDKDQHAHDAQAIFNRAEVRNIWACTGTEAGQPELRKLLEREAKEHGFRIHAHKFGEWVALNKDHLDELKQGYEGPMIPGTRGLSAAQGAHAPRGICWMQGHAKGDGRVLTFGAAHMLTDRSERASHTSNAALTRGIAVFGREFGAGKRVVFMCADVNENDARADVFHGAPFTSISDELGRHPATHGRRAIDVVASYDADRFVKAQSYRVLDDSELRLYTDHYALEATYEVRNK